MQAAHLAAVAGEELQGLDDAGRLLLVKVAVPPALVALQRTGMPAEPSELGTTAAAAVARSSTVPCSSMAGTAVQAATRRAGQAALASRRSHCPCGGRQKGAAHEVPRACMGDRSSSRETRGLEPVARCTARSMSSESLNRCDAARRYASPRDCAPRTRQTQHARAAWAWEISLLCPGHGQAWSCAQPMLHTSGHTHQLLHGQALCRPSTQAAAGLHPACQPLVFQQG